MRILIIRHADPDYANDTLTEKGHREAKLLADKLSKERIDYFYCSPLGRAKDTCAYVAKACGKENEVVVKDWLKEFGCAVTLPSGRNRGIPWDMYPEEWMDSPQMYDGQTWFQQSFYEVAGIEPIYRTVVNGLDGVLAEHGYIREGAYYRVEKENTKTIAFFCHFGAEMVLLSRLFNLSPVPLWHHFCALPSAVTTLYSEERREGRAVFRCCGFGDIGHLYAGGEQPSKSARFCEVYHSDERHD